MIEEKPQFTQQAMNGILVAKNLERIADHASNIATDVIFWIRGADVRHQLSMSWIERRPSQALQRCSAAALRQPATTPDARTQTYTYEVESAETSAFRP